MSDLVERLRGRARGYRLGGPKEMAALMDDAADEIARLRAEVETWVGHAKTAIWSDSEECKLLTADNERLRAALERIGYTNAGQSGMTLPECIAAARAALEEGE